MERIRIVLAEVPKMLRDILREAIDRHPNLVTVAELTEGEDPRLTVATLRPNVVLQGGGPPAAGRKDAALAQAHPPVHIVTVSASGRRAAIQGPRQDRITLENASPDQLLAFLKCLVEAEGTSG